MTRLKSINLITRDLSEFGSPSSGAAASTTWTDGGTHSLRFNNANAPYAQIYNGDSLAEWFLTFSFQHNGASDATATLVSWWAGATQLGSLRLEKTTNKLLLYTSTGTLAATSAGSLNPGTKYVISLHVKIADSGNLDVKVDGNDFVSYAGDTKPGADTGCTIVAAGTSVSSQQPSQYAYAANFLFNDTGGGAPDNTYPIYAQLIPMYASGDGNYSDLAGSDGNSVSNYQQVDDLATTTHDSDTTYNAGDADGEKDSYAMTDPTLPTGTIVSLIPVAVVRKTGTPATTVILAPRSNGTDGTGTSQALAVSYAPLAERFTLDPSGSGAWTGARVNAVEVIVEADGAFT